MCYKCHIAEKESKDPLAIRIREIFGISKQELWERNMFYLLKIILYISIAKSAW